MDKSLRSAGELIEAIDDRAMATDGDVTPTEDEIYTKEIKRLCKLVWKAYQRELKQEKTSKDEGNGQGDVSLCASDVMFLEEVFEDYSNSKELGPTNLRTFKRIIDTIRARLAPPSPGNEAKDVDLELIADRIAVMSRQDRYANAVDFKEGIHLFLLRSLPQDTERKS